MGLWPFGKKETKAATRAKPIPEAPEITETRSVAGGLSVPKSRELFEVIQLREVVPRLPDDFAGKFVAHLLFTGSPLTASFREKGAGKVLVGYMGRVRTQRSPNETELRFKTMADRLPLKEWCCRWALMSAPTIPSAPTSRLIQELGRIIEPGGGAAIIDWHPYSKAVLEAVRQRPAVDEAEGIGLEKYFRAFSKVGLMATEIREIFVDGGMRKLMETDEDKNWYQKHRREPLAIIIFAKKTK